MWRRYLTFWGRNRRRDVNDEIDFHLEMRGRNVSTSVRHLHSEFKLP